MRAGSIPRKGAAAACSRAASDGRSTPAPRLRRAVQRWLNRGHGDPLSTTLAAVFGRWARRRGDRPRPRAQTPTIVVGALSVGGAGKTPVVEHLARVLARAGVHPIGIVGHGYGGRVSRPTWVDGPDGARFGDEAAALYTALSGAGIRARIIVGGSRAARHRQAAARGGVVLVDDGFQDHTLPRTADLVVVDATADRRVMPAGPLREPWSALGRADAVWLHKVDEPGARLDGVTPLVSSRVVPRAVWLPDGRRVDPDWLVGRALRPLCAIGRPASFHHTLRAAGARLLPGCVRADHHRFGAAELARLPAGAWITTTKDRARLPHAVPAHLSLAVLEIGLELVTGADALAERLRDWCGAVDR